MKSMGNRMKSIPFRFKLMLSYLLLIIVPVTVVSLFSYNIALEALKKHTRANMELAASQVADNITYKLDSIIRISDYLYNDLNLQKILRKEYEDFDMLDLSEYIRYYMIPLLDLPVLHNHIMLCIDNPAFPDYYEPVAVENDPMRQQRRYIIYNLNSKRMQEWMSMAREGHGSVLWKQLDSDAEFGNISLLRELYDLDNVLFKGTQKSELGFIRISIKIADLFNEVYFEKFGNSSRFALEDGKGEFLYSHSDAGRENWEAINASGQYLAIRKSIPGLEATLHVLVPVSQLEESAQKVKTLSIVICLASVLVFTVISFILSRFFAVRVANIVAFINSFKDGKFRRKLKISQDDEFSQIAVAVQDMTSTIDRLISEVHQSNAKKTEAELQVLQSQINPHFLYNTLASISTLAQLGQIEKLNAMIKGLAAFYRLTLNGGKFVIEIEKEIQQVKAYIDIRKAQYGNRMSVCYHIDTEILNLFTLKVILQPFVENVLQHAMFGSRKINLVVSAEREGDRVVFKIIDDGVGMAPETAARLLESGRERHGYGVWNVNERIKLQFGTEYGVSVFSRPGIGTTVSICVPALADVSVTERKSGARPA